MYKKILCIALTLGVSVMGFAQKAEAEQTAVSKTYTELMDKINSGLKFEKAKVNFGIANGEAGRQFLLEGSKVPSFLSSNDIKKRRLKTVYKYMSRKKNGVETTIFSDADATTSKIGDGQRNKKFEIVDRDKYARYQTTSETNVVAKKGEYNSNSKFHVTFQWLAKLNTGKDAETQPVKKVILTAVKTVEIDFLASEKITMQAVAKQLIEDWYANLTAEQLGGEYAKVALSVKANSGDITVSLPDSKNIIVGDANVPAIRVDIDPMLFVESEDVMFFSSMEAYHTLAPTFVIAIDEDLKTGSITEIYYEDTLQQPVVDTEKLEKWIAQQAAADKTAENFANKLSAYMQNPNKEIRTELENMFAKKPNGIRRVEVSNLSNQGKESIDNRTLEQYFSRLKGTSMKITLGKPIIENDALDTVVYPFNQEFNSKTYCDKTDKELFLVYDAEAAKYLIEKVTVTKESTKNCSK